MTENRGDLEVGRSDRMFLRVRDGGPLNYRQTSFQKSRDRASERRTRKALIQGCVPLGRQQGAGLYGWWVRSLPQRVGCPQCWW